MKLSLEQIQKMIDLEKQLDKCKQCPCVSQEPFGFIGCFQCEHWKKDCADSDCSTGHINKTDSLSLCSADDCALTWAAISMITEQTAKGGTQ